MSRLVMMANDKGLNSSAQREITTGRSHVGGTHRGTKAAAVHGVVVKDEWRMNKLYLLW